MSAQLYDFGDALGAGFADMLDSGRGYQLAVVPLKDILVREQVRTEMDDETSTIEEMGGSIKEHGILQTLLLRPIDGPIPYELVAGERRYRGATKAGETEVPCLIKEMTDEQKDDIQFAENVQRKNLTQVEEAKKIQKDLDAANGDVEAVMAKHHKGRSWVSKMLGLLTLSPQARRLLSENISADLEVIGKVKTIEKIDQEAAKNLVDDLARTRGKEDARKKADAVKDQVKPPKAKPAAPVAAAAPHQGATPGQPVGGFAEAKKEGGSAWPFPTSSAAVKGSTPTAAAGPAPEVPAPTASPQETLDKAYGLIFEHGSSAKMFVEMLEAGDRAAVESFLRGHYDAGKDGALADTPRAVMQGLRKGTFAADGAGAYAMMAFLHGTIWTVQPFDLLPILNLAKA
jgi:ParB/RepB/Spo0J family partition protein